MGGAAAAPRPASGPAAARGYAGPVQVGRRIDLHTHSRVSDGTEPPADVVRQARAAGLDAIALTDHDSTAGWAEAREAAVATGMGLIPGIELSTRLDWRSVHVLGYLVDPAHPGLVAETARIRQSREARARRIVDRIGIDYPLVWATTSDQASG